jgi:H+/Cl- antiporter ClcA
VQTAAPPRARWLLRLAVVTALVGIGSGIGGLVVSLGLHALERLAFGYSKGSFLEGLLSTDPWRRAWVLAIAGVIGGVGWWALRRWGKPVVSVEEATDGARMPTIPTLANAALQIVIVGLGASIGREVAPRELGALVAGWITDKAGVTARERRILVACGAGAGLAAVYDVPLGGAVFAIEILLAELSFATALPALATSAIAALVARLVVPGSPLYHLPQFTLSPSLTVWSLIAGPVIGFAAFGFVALVRFASHHRPSGSWILIVMPVVFTLVGLAAVAFPAILGNGQALGQTAFTAATPLVIIAALLVLKVVATSATIGAGAAGGTLTPSLAIGAAFGATTGILWSALWPGSPVAAFAFIAAAAFLASSMRAPLTAIILLLEFTNQGPALLVPTLLAVAGSVAVTYVFGRQRLTGAA